eukprot:866049-Prymnesium_polylepis.1
MLKTNAPCGHVRQFNTAWREHHLVKQLLLHQTARRSARRRLAPARTGVARSARSSPRATAS